jgi:DNA-binding transcriptional MerR regulator
MQNPHLCKIGDFSKIGQVTVRMLRHYDELGLLKPAYVDRLTDYRYYSIEQLPKLNRLLALKDLGFSLVQIAALLNDDLPALQLRGMFLMKRAEAEREVHLFGRENDLALLAPVPVVIEMQLPVEKNTTTPL